MLNPRKSKWDEYAIKAEIRRRGFTMEALGKHLGVRGAAVRTALTKPYSDVNHRVAQFLNIPVHELWPDWFDFEGDVIPKKYREKLSRRRADSASRESRAG